MNTAHSVDVSTIEAPPETVKTDEIGLESGRGDPLAEYETSAAMIKTLDNDSSLFVVAWSAGIWKLLIKGLEYTSTKNGGEGFNLKQPLWKLAPYSEWCISCQEMCGAQPRYRE